jgi:hypothetical protein
MQSGTLISMLNAFSAKTDACKQTVARHAQLVLVAGNGHVAK